MPPAKIANEVTLPPSMNKYQLARLSRGNARSRAPIISGTMKLPSVFGIDGIRKNHTMMMPCMVNEPIVGIGTDQIGLRRGKLDADQGCRGSSDEEENGQAGKIQDRDPLVIRGEKPGAQRITGGSDSRVSLMADVPRAI